MERGWQINKSLRQCNQHMLDNQIGCDVTFEIQSPDGSSTTVPAHKYMLVSRSPVFEAMLYGPALYKEGNNNIVITDIEPAVFKEMLKFMYTESCTITAHNVLFLMTAAKKYILDQLLDLCSKFLEQNLDDDNVCIILEHCHQQDEVELVKKCMDYLAPKAKKVLDMDAFLELSEPTLCHLLECDDLCIDTEFSVYQACLKWAKKKLKTTSQDVTDVNIRETLGKCLYQIRFHQMSIDELSDDSLGCSDILTSDELKFLFIYLSNNTSEKAAKAKDILGRKFNQRIRTGHIPLICKRFNTKPTVIGWICKPSSSNAILVQVSKSIDLAGLGLFGAANGETICCDINISDDSGRCLYSKKETVVSNGQSDPYQIPIRPPIALKKDTQYEIQVVKTGNLCWYVDKGGQKTVTVEGVTFTFENACTSKSLYTCISRGQIPELLFRNH